MSRAIKIAKLQARGDPGLFDVIKKGVGLLGKGVKAAAGVARHIPVIGAPAGVAHDVLTKLGVNGNGSAVPQPIQLPAAPIAPPPPMYGGGGQLMPGNGTGISIGGPKGVRIGKFGQPMPAAGPTSAQVQLMNGMRPAGYKLNKTGYFLKDGTYVPPGTRWVKIRRRNPFNPRALDRACGRLNQAQRATKWLHKQMVPRKPRKARSC